MLDKYTYVKMDFHWKYRPVLKKKINANAAEKDEEKNAEKQSNSHDYSIDE